MIHDKLRYYLILSVVFCLFLACSNDGKKVAKGIGETSVYKSWEHYLGDPERTHYSELTQIDTNNVHQLQIAWTYGSGGLKDGRNSQIQANPLIIDEKLISVNAANMLFAIKNDTGEKIWEFKPASQDQSGLGLSRGLCF